MKIIPIPVKYEWIERLFGTYIADHFNDISLTLLIIGFCIWAIFGKKQKVRTVRKEIPVPKQREISYCIDEEGHIIPDRSTQNRTQTEEQPIVESYFGQYDRYSDLTDEEMKLAMQMKVVRDYPSYEEWKAQKLKEQQETQTE